VLDLAKAGFPEHAGDLIGREERGEVDIAGSEKRLFRLGLGSGHYETEDDFRPGRTTRGPAKRVADRGWRQVLGDGEPGDERNRLWRETRIR
jgi:hypothetical protein